MNKGIYMLALGYPNYGKMAAVLAASMRLIDKQIKIAVLSDCTAMSSLSKEELDLFDHTISLERFYFENEDGSFNPIKARIICVRSNPI
jgi:hypothetical protein